MVMDCPGIPVIIGCKGARPSAPLLQGYFRREYSYISYRGNYAKCCDISLLNSIVCVARLQHAEYVEELIRDDYPLSVRILIVWLRHIVHFYNRESPVKLEANKIPKTYRESQGNMHIMLLSARAGTNKSCGEFKE